MITRGVCQWAGVPLAADDLPEVARDLVAMVDAVRDLSRGGERIPEHAMVLYDLWGRNHDAELWGLRRIPARIGSGFVLRPATR